MKFETKQTLQGSVDEVENAMFNEKYPSFLLQHHGVLLEAELIEKKDNGDSIDRKVRYRPKPVIENIGTKKVPPEWFAFIENSSWSKSKKQLKFSNVPTSSKISGMLLNTGVLTLKSSGNGQTERTVEGEIALKLPFLLKPLAIIAERVIHAEGMKILANEVPVINAFIQEVRKGNNA